MPETNGSAAKPETSTTVPAHMANPPITGMSMTLPAKTVPRTNFR